MYWFYTKVLYTSMSGGYKGSFTPSSTLPNRATSYTMYAKGRSLTSTYLTSLSGHILTHTNTPSLSKPNVCPLCPTMHRPLPKIKSYLNRHRNVEVNRSLYHMHKHTWTNTIKLIYFYNYFNIPKLLAYYIKLSYNKLNRFLNRYSPYKIIWNCL